MAPPWILQIRLVRFEHYIYPMNRTYVWEDWGKEKSVEEVDEFFLHVFVDVSVAGEGLLPSLWPLREPARLGS